MHHKKIIWVILHLSRMQTGTPFFPSCSEVNSTGYSESASAVISRPFRSEKVIWSDEVARASASKNYWKGLLESLARSTLSTVLVYTNK